MVQHCVPRKRMPFPFRWWNTATTEPMVCYPRSKVTFPRLSAEGSPQFWTADVFTISSRGLRLLLERWVEPGTLLSVELRSCHFLRTLQARVLCTKANQEGWLHSCEFVSPLANDELQALLS